MPRSSAPAPLLRGTRIDAPGRRAAHSILRRGPFMRGEPPPPPLVLVVERDLQVRELQRYFLERAAFSVQFVDDGLAALEHARVASPVLVITEILLPRLDGLTLCRALRDDPLTHDIPVVVFSILSAAARAADAGARAFLRKPLVESTFLAAVRDAIAVQSTGILEPQ